MKVSIEFELPEEKNEYQAALGEIKAMRGIKAMFRQIQATWRDVDSSAWPDIERLVKELGETYRHYAPKEKEEAL